MKRNTHKEIISRLRVYRGTPLSKEEQQRLWQSIVCELPLAESKSKVVVHSVESPLTNLIYTRFMAPIIIGLIVLIGGGATVAASDNARPGDLLFPIDTTVENVRLAIANDEKKKELRVTFAQERVDEITSLVSEDTQSSSDSNTQDTSSSGANALEIEADIFTDITIVKVERNGTKQYYETATTDETALATEIATEFDIPTSEVVAVLQVQVEDRASRPEDRGKDKKKETRRKNIEKGVTAFLSLATTDTEQSEDFAELLATLESTLAEDEEDLEIKVKDGRFELRSDDTRIEVDRTNGEVRIRTDDDEDDSEENDREDENDDKGTDDVSDSDDSKMDDEQDEQDEASEDESAQSGSGSDEGGTTSDNATSLEIEADVFTDITIVTVEQNDTKQYYETATTDETALATEIATEFNLTLTDVTGALRLEVEDRASRPEDRS